MYTLQLFSTETFFKGINYVVRITHKACVKCQQLKGAGFETALKNKYERSLVDMC